MASAETSRVSGPRKKANVDETVEQEQEEQAVDRLTSLPHDILVNEILSFLPTRDAITCTLMKWGLDRLWYRIFNLDFEWSWDPRAREVIFIVEFRRFFAFVDRAMTLHTSPRVSKFRLKLDCGSASHSRIDINQRRRIDVWVESAIRSNVETLDLEFVSCTWLPCYGYNLPAPVLRSDSLVELRLVRCYWRPNPGICMKTLKHLDLKRVSLTNDKIDGILSACPLLEKFSLDNCDGSYNMVNCESPILKTVAISADQCYHQRITVSGPYIASLHISGWIAHVYPGDLPSLDDATLDVSDRYSLPHNYVTVKTVFQNLSHAKVLTLHEQPILAAMIWDLKKVCCPSFKLQRLVLRTSLSKWLLPGVANLLRHSPSLERLDLHVHPVEHRHRPVDDGWLNRYKFDDNGYGASRDHSFSCLRNSLKRVKISGDVVKDTVIQFVQFLLSKALVLEELIICIDKRDRNTKSAEVKIYEDRVQIFLKASRNVVVTVR